MRSVVVTALVLTGFGSPAWAAPAETQQATSQADQLSPEAKRARAELPKPADKHTETTKSASLPVPRPRPTVKSAAPSAPVVPAVVNPAPVVAKAPVKTAALAPASAPKVPKIKPPLSAPVKTHKGPLVLVPPKKIPPSHAPIVHHVPQAPKLTPHAVLAKGPKLGFVDRHMQLYRSAYHQQLLTRNERYQRAGLFTQWRLQYRPWVKAGFYAYGWDVRPMVEFYTYFSNPCVAWFYTDYDEEFYRPFYAAHLRRYPDLGRSYNHVGIFLPTEEFIHLNVTVSEMPVEAQINYRRAMTYLSERLSENSHGPIGRHEVVMNHYQMLPDNRAVAIEGFVDGAKAQIPFKALVDLNNADQSELFAIGSWQVERQPTPEQTADLNELNDQIVDRGGSLEAAPGT